VNRKDIGYMILVVFAFSGFLMAQEDTSQKIELPTMTPEYKLNRALINQVGNFMHGIAYAKAKGDSPEDFATFGLNVWGSWWKDGDFTYYVRKWFRIFSIDENFKMEILSETEDKIDLKMNIFGERYIETYTESGVTKEEYIRYLVALLSSMAKFMGLEHEQKIEDDWIYLSIVKK
jgi:hypothetical protein